MCVVGDYHANKEVRHPYLENNFKTKHRRYNPYNRYAVGVLLLWTQKTRQSGTCQRRYIYPWTATYYHQNSLLVFHATGNGATCAGHQATYGDTKKALGTSLNFPQVARLSFYMFCGCACSSDIVIKLFIRVATLLSRSTCAYKVEM